VDISGASPSNRVRILVAAERLGRAGGMERYLDVVLPALAARGAAVHVLARTVDAVPPGVTADAFAWSDEHDDPSASAADAVGRAIDAFAPDVAVAHNVMDAAVVEALRAVPRFAYHVHDHRPFCPNGDRLFPRTAGICGEPMGRPCAVHALTDGCAYGPRRRTLALIARRERLRDAVASADAVIVASRYMADVAARSGIERGMLVEIAPPLPDEAFAPDPGMAGGAPRSIVFAGRIVPQKGLDALIRAMRFIPGDRRPVVRAFGVGPALAGARDEAARRGVTLEAPGEVEPEAVRAAIDASALVAMPSIWAEPFGYVGIEAFARARPVVAFDVGGVRTWLEHGANGFAVERGNEDALGNMIQLLLDDDAQRAQLARNARRTAERFRLDATLDALLAAYR
jgi:glycosyltransferase involved in cell wall biosynthesis